MKKNKTALSSFLFPTPSGLSGVGRFLDFGASFDVYNSSESEEAADETAIFADWKAVGDDLRAVSRRLCTEGNDVDEEKAA